APTFYASATVSTKSVASNGTVTYSSQKGAPIVYGITIPSQAANKQLAAQFIYILLSDLGRYIMEVENAQPVLNPPMCDHPENLPALLRSLNYTSFNST
ncbi:MAG TPA: hypothetical protein VEG28_00195, partial [Dehalococcoidia bacterium]|nr:hypothetical protein [Dehalococcoidia bacterium]